MITSRRSFLTGLGASLIVAPAIVRAASLMPVRGIVMPVTMDCDLALPTANFWIVHPNMYFDLRGPIDWNEASDTFCAMHSAGVIEGVKFLR